MSNSHNRVQFILQENEITEENRELLRLLDCLRLFKIIPDTTPDRAFRQLLQLLEELDEQRKEEVKKLAPQYNPQTIALLGAMLETLNPKEGTDALFKRLNPMTEYKLAISEKILPTRGKWRIK